METYDCSHRLIVFYRLLLCYIYIYIYIAAQHPGPLIHLWRRTCRQYCVVLDCIIFYCADRVFDLIALKKLLVLMFRCCGTLYQSTVDRLSHSLLLNGIFKTWFIIYCIFNAYQVIVITHLWFTCDVGHVNNSVLYCIKLHTKCAVYINYFIVAYS